LKVALKEKFGWSEKFDSSGDSEEEMLIKA
jgi:hypothetical protein